MFTSQIPRSSLRGICTHKPAVGKKAGNIGRIDDGPLHNNIGKEYYQEMSGIEKHMGNKAYKITKYDMRREPSLGLTIALVADLHEKSSPGLLETIRSQHPDLILMPGDVLERHDSRQLKKRNISPEEFEKWLDTGKNEFSRFQKFIHHILTSGYYRLKCHHHSCYGSQGLQFLQEARRIAPVILSNGNHEMYYLKTDDQFFARHNIILLDNADTTVTIQGRSLSIGGLSIRYDMEWLKSFSARPGYKILLVHNPDTYRQLIQNSAFDTFQLILSGHYHGGQWRTSNNTGVFIPRRGFFVKDIYGKFDRLIISAGCSNTTAVPRINNPEEIVIISI